MSWLMRFNAVGLAAGWKLCAKMRLSGFTHMIFRARWLLLYIERWLKAPMQMEDGSIAPRMSGTPQGGVISPTLANLFVALRYSRPRGFSRLWLLPWHRNAGSHVPYKSLVELRAAYTPDAARAVSGHPPELIPEEGSPPGFDIT
jgi:hypothetical protein